jgi:FlaA1/EpsC-like NDP-sugar epimerase
MNHLLCRVLLAIALAPLGIAIYIGLFIGCENTLRDFFAFAWAGIFTWVFVVFYWLGLWRGFVRWSVRRKILIVLGIPACALVGALFGAIVDVPVRRPPEGVPAAIFAAILGIPLWLIATVWIWRETAAERARRLQASAGKALFCPKCGYNMTGLYESRCPECGERFTLDQLLAAQQPYRIEDIIPPGNPKETATTTDPSD